MAVRVPLPLAGGPGIEETARVLRTLQLALERIRHDTAAEIVAEPRIEVKAMLAAQLYDDARSLIKLERRLAALPATGEIALAEPPVKPAVVKTVRDLLRRVDPVVDERTARLLTQLVARQDRHADELGLRGIAGTLAIAPGRPQPPEVRPRPGQPARERFIEIGGAGDGGLHDLIHAKLCAAELAALASHEQPGAGAGHHADAARAAADHTRHALIIDRVAGGIWGRHGVPPGYVTELPPLPREPEAVFDFLRADLA